MLSKPTRGGFDVHDLVHVDDAHLGELHEVLGLAIGVSPYVDEQRGLGVRGNDLAERGALDALDATHDQRGGRKAGACRPLPRKTPARLLPSPSGIPPRWRSPSSSARLARMLAHLDDLARNLSGAAFVGFREGNDHVLGSAQDDLKVGSAASAMAVPSSTTSGALSPPMASTVSVTDSAT